MKLQIPLVKPKKTSEKRQIRSFESLPLTLTPIFSGYVEIGDIVSEYEINLFKVLPAEIIDNLNEKRIELNIANPHVFISFEQNKAIYKYNLIEPPLDQESLELYLLLVSEIERELLSEKEHLDLGSILVQLHERGKYKIFEGKRGDLYILSTKAKVTLYYLLRNITGYNILAPLLADPKIEDISCNGMNLPVYVYHRDYEYMPTNIIFTEKIPVVNYIVDGKQLLDQLVMKLLSLSGKSISIANPISEGMLPKGERIAATFKTEVSATGSSFVIRRFSEAPITILDLINSNTLSPEIAAYLWYAMDLKLSFMVIGVTGSGKTTTLNSTINLVKESSKIVSIEDIPEIKIAHENWVQLYARPAYAGIGKEITLMDLLKLALRYRPDLIVVGEIRGAEAYVLFQAFSTGHGGATTFHAYDTESAIKRLMNEPINIPKEWIPMMNIVLTVRRVPIYTGEKIVVRRRVVAVDEILSVNDIRRVSYWDPKRDVHVFEPINAKVMAARLEEVGKTIDDAVAELERRATYLSALASIREIVKSPESYKEVKKYIIKYSLKPEEAYKEVTAMAKISPRA
ncbi:MAG: type II/IV secretion system ATPase subunit [Sulfolobaceae archaeon]